MRSRLALCQRLTSCSPCSSLYARRQLCRVAFLHSRHWLLSPSFVGLDGAHLGKSDSSLLTPHVEHVFISGTISAQTEADLRGDARLVLATAVDRGDKPERVAVIVVLACLVQRYEAAGAHGYLAQGEDFPAVR